MAQSRKFLRVVDFDELQPPRRPKRAPHWLKLHVRYLDLEPYRNLSLAARGVLVDLMRVARLAIIGSRIRRHDSLPMRYQSVRILLSKWSQRWFKVDS